MAKKDLNAIMKQRLAESMAALEQSRERSLNTFSRNTSDNDPAAQASSNQIDSGWSIDMPNDVKDVGTEVYTAPTANPKRPRAYTVGYNWSCFKQVLNILVSVIRSNTKCVTYVLPSAVPAAVAVSAAKAYPAV